VLSFFPKSIDRTETIAYMAYVLLLLILIALGWTAYRRWNHGVSDENRNR